MKGLARFRPLTPEQVKAMSESYPVFCSTLGIHLYPWQADAFGTAFRREQGRFVHRLAGISVPRGNGKTFGDATGGMWRFRFGPPGTTILSVGLLSGAQ
jgi:phage terminase large subunit-like protein